jgi:DNA-binding CsgD family transcriptional regulator
MRFVPTRRVSDFLPRIYLEKLATALNTVKTQVKRISRKLDIGSRHEACEVARRLGWL